MSEMFCKTDGWQLAQTMQQEKEHLSQKPSLGLQIMGLASCNPKTEDASTNTEGEPRWEEADSRMKKTRCRKFDIHNGHLKCWRVRVPQLGVLVSQLPHGCNAMMCGHQGAIILQVKKIALSKLTTGDWIQNSISLHWTHVKCPTLQQK